MSRRNRERRSGGRDEGTAAVREVGDTELVAAMEKMVIALLHLASFEVVEEGEEISVAADMDGQVMQIMGGPTELMRAVLNTWADEVIDRGGAAPQRPWNGEG